MAVLFAVLALAFLLETVLAVVPASVSTSTYSKKNFIHAQTSFRIEAS